MTANRLRKGWLIVWPLLLAGCALMEESPQKPVPLGLIVTPASYYSTTKARYLGGRYKENLDRLVDRITRDPKTRGLQFANNIGSVGGIGFFTHSATKTPDERYLEVVLAVPESFETKGDYSAKVARLFSIYGPELLSILSSDSEIYQEKEVSGYGLNFSWRNVTAEPSGSRVSMERAVAYFPKDKVGEFLKKDVDQNKLLGGAIIFAVENDGPMSLVSYKPQEIKPDVRPPIQEESLAEGKKGINPETKPSSAKPSAAQVNETPKIQNPQDNRKREPVALNEKRPSGTAEPQALQKREEINSSTASASTAKPAAVSPPPFKLQRKPDESTENKQIEPTAAEKPTGTVKAAESSDQTPAAMTTSQAANKAPEKPVEPSAQSPTAVEAKVASEPAKATAVTPMANRTPEFKTPEKAAESDVRSQKAEPGTSPQSSPPVGVGKKEEVAKVTSESGSIPASVTAATSHVVEPRISEKASEKAEETVSVKTYAEPPAQPQPVEAKKATAPAIASSPSVETAKIKTREQPVVRREKAGESREPSRPGEQSKPEAVIAEAKTGVKTSEIKSAPVAPLKSHEDKALEKPAGEQIALAKNEPMESVPEKKALVRPIPKALEGYVIQIAFNDKGAAKHWAETLERRGFAVSVTEVGSGGPLRVRIGNFPLRDDAERQLRSFRQEGLKGIVINLPQAYRPEVRPAAAEEGEKSVSALP